MLTLSFMRHAETVYNRDGIFSGRIDCDATPEGLENAKSLLDNGEKNFDFIYISPLKRTRQTLDAILPNANSIIDERITEASLGEWEGKRKSDYDKDLVSMYRAGKYFPPGAETNEDVDKRVCAFVESLFCKYHNSEKILIVAHNGVMKSIKRNFVKDYDNIMSKNLQIITITNADFEYYLQNKNNKPQQGTI